MPGSNRLIPTENGLLGKYRGQIGLLKLTCALKFAFQAVLEPLSAIFSCCWSSLVQENEIVSELRMETSRCQERCLSLPIHCLSTKCTAHKSNVPYGAASTTVMVFVTVTTN